MKYVYEIAPTDEDVNVKNLKSFYRFMHERQAIYFRRFVERLPQSEWTDDKILKERKYTNIFRELDRGTIWMFDNIVKKQLFARCDRHEKGQPNHSDTRKTILNMVWRICVYRLLNKVETFDKIGVISYNDFADERKRKTWFNHIEKLAKEGKETKEKVWTSAHITLQSNLKVDRIENYRIILGKLHPRAGDLSTFIANAEHMEDVWNKVIEEYGFGPFISYEVTTDFSYLCWTAFDDNEWANAGPGCIPGIQLIFPNVERKQTAYMEKMTMLRNEQTGMFKKLKLDFFHVSEGRRLSIRNIEHSLCEWRKYHMQSIGKGRPRPKFHPITEVV